MPTLMTDPRSGGVKKSSGVNVLPIVAESECAVWTDSLSRVLLVCKANTHLILARSIYRRISYLSIFTRTTNQHVSFVLLFIPLILFTMQHGPKYEMIRIRRWIG